MSEIVIFNSCVLCFLFICIWKSVSIFTELKQLFHRFNIRWKIYMKVAKEGERETEKKRTNRKQSTWVDVNGVGKFLHTHNFRVNAEKNIVFYARIQKLF